MSGYPDDEEESGPTSSLQAAARVGNVEGIHAALAAGGDPMAKDRWGLAALHSAAICGSPDAISALVEHRASIDDTNMRGQSALHLAAAEGRNDAIVKLLELKADVVKPSAYGTSVLELVTRRSPGSSGLRLIQDELVTRYTRLDDEEKELRRQLEYIKEKRKHLEVQVHSFRPPTPKEEVTPGPTPGPTPRDPTDRSAEYWVTTSHAIAAARERGQEALRRARLREPPKFNRDPFPWTGKHIGKNAIPQPDPDDADLVAGYEWLKEVAIEEKRRERRHQALDHHYDEVQAREDEAMRERTGKTQTEWNEFVRDIQEKGGSWDWSKLKIQQASDRYRGADRPSRGLDRAGVFAQGVPGTVVFRMGDVIGPMPGLIMRRSKYEKKYYGDLIMSLHDPLGYEYTLRAQTTDLKLEPLVLDLTAGSAQNRLRYMADVRMDPLCLGQLLPSVPAAGPSDFLPTRSRMPRPRSRPGSPEDRFKRGAMQGTGEQRPPPTPQSMQAVRDMHAGASALLAEVLVDGWPYVFVVAARDVMGSEEITVDYGQAHWATQRATLTRLLEIGKLGRETVVKVDGKPDSPKMARREVDYAAELPQRKPVRRACEEDAPDGTFLEAPADKDWLGLPDSPARKAKTFPAPAFPEDQVEEPPDIWVADEEAAEAEVSPEDAEEEAPVGDEVEEEVSEEEIVEGEK